MQNPLGDIILASRHKAGLSQKQYGSRYRVSGQVIFKFEKSYVVPALQLWLKMAADAGISQRRAVLLWAQSKLPPQFQEYIKLQGEGHLGTDFGNALMPPELKEWLEDDEIRQLYRPTDSEIKLLREIISVLGQGNRTLYGETLLIIRAFLYS